MCDLKILMWNSHTSKLLCRTGVCSVFADLCPPNRIVRDKIGEASVKLQFNQEEAWTRALRHVLLALKILLKWTTNGSNG